jgi:hypothetical protein
MIPVTKLPRYALLVLLLTVAAFQFALAQTQNKAAVKFDEFGDINHSYLMARLDNFAVQLMNQSDVKGFIVIYRTRRDLPGTNHAIAMGIKDYLVDSRGLARDRIVPVDGGVAENLTQELWIVPSGSTPIIRSDARIGLLQDPDSAWKFYEFTFLPIEFYRKLGIPHSHDGEVEHIEAYANEVKKKVNQFACIIAYAQYNPRPRLVDYTGDYEPVREVRLDPPSTVRKQLLRERALLTKDYGIPAARINTIDGGYRKRRSIEYWIVPVGEPLPIPTPNSFPHRRRRK